LSNIINTAEYKDKVLGLLGRDGKPEDCIGAVLLPAEITAGH
jgi:hypothetical protein